MHSMRDFRTLLDDMFAWADFLVWCFCVFVLLFCFSPSRCLGRLAATEVDSAGIRSSGLKSPPARAYQKIPGLRDACWARWRAGMCQFVGDDRLL